MSRLFPRLRLSLPAPCPRSPLLLVRPISTLPLTPAPPPRAPIKHKRSKKLPTPLSDLPAPPPSLPSLGATRKATKDEGPSDGQAIALTTAESYDTPALLKGLQALGLLEGGEGGRAVNLMGEAIYIPRWTPSVSSNGVMESGGELFLFESGTIVSWGLSQAGMQQFLRKVVRGATSEGVEGDLGWVERGRYVDPEMEVLEYWVQADGPTRMTGDALYLSSAPASSPPSSEVTKPNAELLARLAFSAGMARVTKLGVYEEQFDEFAEGIRSIPKLLESGSEVPVKKMDIIARVGTLHGFRQKLNLDDENLLDEPEFLWEDSALQGYYSSVCKALEFDSRLRTLNQRVDYAFQLQSTLMDLLNTKTSHRLEWIIIILIAFEITIVLLREGFAIRAEYAEAREKEEALKKGLSLQ